jgi:hypothetical protein
MCLTFKEFSTNIESGTNMKHCNNNIGTKKLVTNCNAAVFAAVNIFGEQNLATVLGLRKQIIAYVVGEQVALFHNAVIEYRK